MRFIVLRRVTSRGTTGLTQKLLAAYNYWLSLPVTDHDAAITHDLSACQSSRLVRYNRFRCNIVPSVIACGRRCVGLTPIPPNWRRQPGLEPIAAGCEDRSTGVIEPDVAPRDQRWFQRVGMRWRPDDRHRTDFRIGTNKLRRRIERGHSPLEAAAAAAATAMAAAFLTLPRRTSRKTTTSILALAPPSFRRDRYIHPQIDASGTDADPMHMYSRALKCANDQSQGRIGHPALPDRYLNHGQTCSRK